MAIKSTSLIINQASWSKISDQYVCNVTDGPFFYMGKTARLYYIKFVKITESPIEFGIIRNIYLL
jgi:hypothetical protein